MPFMKVDTTTYAYKPQVYLSRVQLKGKYIQTCIEEFTFLAQNCVCNMYMNGHAMPFMLVGHKHIYIHSSMPAGQCIHARKC